MAAKRRHPTVDKVCNKCGSLASHGQSLHRNGSLYVQSRCIGCASASWSARTQANRAADGPLLSRLKSQSAWSKVDVEDLQGMLWVQDNKCAICGADDPSALDHDHVSGKIRGFLCFHCNLALGHFKDAPASLEAALAYLALESV